MDLAKFFQPNGRLRRTHYFAASVVINILMRVAEVTEDLFLILASLVLLWPMLMLSIQRAHDMGKDKTLPIVAFALAFFGGVMVEFGSSGIGGLMVLPGVVIGLWILFGKPTAGPNEYGPDPRVPQDHSELTYND